MIKSKVVFTEEIDDLETAVEELCEQVGDFSLQKNSVGIIFMDEDTEYGELYPMLKEKWDIPFVACTALALLTGDEGLKKSGISLMLMSSDDCNFAVGMAEDLSIDDYSWKIKDVYSQMRAQRQRKCERIDINGGNQHGSPCGEKRKSDSQNERHRNNNQRVPRRLQGGGRDYRELHRGNARRGE